MCVFLQMGKQIAALDSMSHRSIFNEYVNTIQPYLFISVIILHKHRVVFTWSRKIELWTTNAALDCLEIGFNSNNDDLG